MCQDRFLKMVESPKIWLCDSLPDLLNLIDIFASILKDSLQGQLHCSPHTDSLTVYHPWAPLPLPWLQGHCAKTLHLTLHSDSNIPGALQSWLLLTRQLLWWLDYLSTWDWWLSSWWYPFGSCTHSLTSTPLRKPISSCLSILKNRWGLRAKPWDLNMCL